MFSKLFRRFQKQKSAPEPESIYKELRGLVFAMSPGDVGIIPSRNNPNVWGVVMETGFPEGVATLVSLADGTTSLYLEGGGGLIGGGGNKDISGATKALVLDAEKYYERLTQTTSFPLPAIDNVRFFILTFSGVYTIEALEEDLGEERHHLSPFFFKCHDVITSIRESGAIGSQT
jgi:hypothetical protein